MWGPWYNSTLACKTSLHLCVKLCVLYAPVGLCPFTHTRGTKRQCLRLCGCVSAPCLHPSVLLLRLWGGLPQLESHAFSKTNDFYQNDNELMTHGGLWTLERNQRRATGARVEAGNVWGLRDLVSQNAQSSSVQILEGKGMGTKTAQRVLETRYQYSQPGLPASSGTLHSLLC